MAKRFQKFLAAVLVLSMLFTLCITPITSFAEDETYEAYDEVTYYDLLKGGSTLPSSGISLSGSDYENLTFNSTSLTHSTVFTFRWIAGTTPKFSLYFDGWSSDEFPFGFIVKSPNSNNGGGATAGANGAWHLDPSKGSQIVQMSEPIVSGQAYDIEYGRLKVKTGPNTGKYYIYAKVNGELVNFYYYDGVDANGTYNTSGQLKNRICFVQSTADNKICATPVEEVYADYAEVEYTDLLVGGNPVPSEIKPGSTTFTYNNAKPTGSAIVKYRWIPTEGSQTQFGFDTLGDEGFEYMFGAQIYKPGSDANYPNGYVWLRPGYGPKLGFSSPLVAGQAYDIEFARLKVLNGPNKNKYYFYFKIGDDFLIEDYVAANVVDKDGNYTSAPGSTACKVSNKFFATSWGGSGSTMTYIPVVELYDEADEITFDDLYDQGGKSMYGRSMDGDQTYTYNATSPSYSTKLKFRWKAGSTPRFTLYLDDWVFPFCLAVKNPNFDGLGKTAGPNGAWHIAPDKNVAFADMDTPIVTGQSYDMEYGRLKVLNGPNKNKYYVYAKCGDETVVSYYYDGVSNGTYGSGTALTNKIIFSALGGNIFSAIPVPETYDEADEIGYEDLYFNNNKVTSEFFGINGSSKIFTYENTSSSYSAIFKFSWIPGIDGATNQFSFDNAPTNMSYPFGVWVKGPNADGAGANGAWHLKPTDNGMRVDMTEKIKANTPYAIELGRLKVLTGYNTGKYYVYLKVNNELVQSTYIDVDANGHYSSASADCCVGNNIYFYSGDANKNIITSASVPQAFTDFVDYKATAKANAEAVANIYPAYDTSSIVANAKADIDALTYNASKSGEQNIGELDYIVTVAGNAVTDLLNNDKDAFDNNVRATVKAKIGGMEDSDDTTASAALISKAIAAVDNYVYDSTKTDVENAAVLTAINTKLIEDLAANRQAVEDQLHVWRQYENGITTESESAFVRFIFTLDTVTNDYLDYGFYITIDGDEVKYSFKGYELDMLGTYDALYFDNSDKADKIVYVYVEVSNDAFVTDILAKAYFTDEAGEHIGGQATANVANKFGF